MSAYDVTSRLEAVRQTGAGQWVARCPAHNDRSPSLSIRELDDDRVLLHCFSGCNAEEILSAMGLDFSALFPEKPRDGLYVKNPSRPFNAMSVLNCVAFEALVVQCAASDVAKGNPLSETDRERLLLAASRLQRAVEIANGE